MDAVLAGLCLCLVLAGWSLAFYCFGHDLRLSLPALLRQPLEMQLDATLGSHGLRVLGQLRNWSATQHKHKTLIQAPCALCDVDSASSVQPSWMLLVFACACLFVWWRAARGRTGTER